MCHSFLNITTCIIQSHTLSFQSYHLVILNGISFIPTSDTKLSTHKTDHYILQVLNIGNLFKKTRSFSVNLTWPPVGFV